MYIHIGQDVALLTGEILGVFDLDNASHSRDTRRLLERYEKDGRLVTVGDGLPRSFILTGDPLGEKIYLTQISSRTIAKRLERQPDPV